MMAEQRQQLAGTVARADIKALVLNCKYKAERANERQQTRGSVDLQTLKASHCDTSSSKARLPQPPQNSTKN